MKGLQELQEEGGERVGCEGREGRHKKGESGGVKEGGEANGGAVSGHLGGTPQRGAWHRRMEGGHIEEKEKARQVSGLPRSGQAMEQWAPGMIL